MGHKLLEVGEDLPRRLLVEGSDDFHSLCNLFASRKIPNRFGIKEKNGYPNLLKTLDVEVDKPGLIALGIVVDADEDLPGRWQSLRNRLAELGYTEIRNEPETHGAIAYPVENPELPTVGIWIMPNNQIPGILENFIAFLIPDQETNPLWQYATQCVAAIPEEHQAFPTVRIPKALLHTWLAWQEEPGKPIGQAIAARYLDPDSESADCFIHWVKRLFELS